MMCSNFFTLRQPVLENGQYGASSFTMAKKHSFIGAVMNGGWSKTHLDKPVLKAIEECIENSIIGNQLTSIFELVN